jgi:hypothetical protein
MGVTSHVRFFLIINQLRLLSATLIQRLQVKPLYCFSQALSLRIQQHCRLVRLARALRTGVG